MGNETKSNAANDEWICLSNDPVKIKYVNTDMMKISIVIIIFLLELHKINYPAPM